MSKWERGRASWVDVGGGGGSLQSDSPCSEQASSRVQMLHNTPGNSLYPLDRVYFYLTPLDPAGREVEAVNVRVHLSVLNQPTIDVEFVVDDGAAVQVPGEGFHQCQQSRVSREIESGVERCRR